MTDLIEVTGVVKRTDVGICIQRADGLICWLPALYVSINLFLGTVHAPDWVKMDWHKPPPPRANRRRSAKEMLAEVSKHLHPRVKLHQRKDGKYHLKVDGRKKHWSHLTAKEALVVVQTLLAMEIT